MTLQRYAKERALANYFPKKTRKKARLEKWLLERTEHRAQFSIFKK